MEKKDFYLLQVNDALFPIGGYSHSMGLETYIQKGIVHDEKTAAQYVANKIRWSLAPTDLLAVRFAYEAAEDGNLDRLPELEDMLGASRIPFEQREASRKMGSRFVKTIEKAGIPMEEDSIYKAYIEKRGKSVISHCIIYGIFCAVQQISKENALSCFLYSQTSAMVTNCVKTVPLSQSTGQKILCGCYPLFEDILQRIKTWTEDDFCLSAPGFDLRGIQHERLYSRIYMS